MNPEDEYIVKQFKSIFIENCNHPIVIYGTGIRTENLLCHIDKDRIIGLMDPKHTGEVMFGKRVFDYDEVAQIPDVIIVIIARNSVIHVIYRRIRDFTEKNGIGVYDVNGMELKSVMVSTTEKECFGVRVEDLEAAIRNADVVSFDIFDTLLCRSVLRPTDVFALVDQELQRMGKRGYVFSKERVRAEKELSHLDSPTIYEIYEQLGRNTGETKEALDHLLEIEIATEQKLLYPRKRMCEKVQEISRMGKKVLLISDMYFTKDILKKLLAQFGITDYDELYVSSEFHRWKATGLYETVRERENITGSWLHIGDNPYADVVMPQRCGIQTFQIYSTVEMLEQSIYAEVLESAGSLEEKVVLAQFAAQAYNDPFGKFDRTGKISVDRADFLGELIFAPIIFKYLLWLVQHLQKDQVDLVFFPSRDGYILKQIYDQIGKKGLPQGEYLYTSRRTAMVAAADTAEHVKEICEFPGEDTVGKRAQKRFRLKDDYGYPSDQFVTAALQECERERKNYLFFLKKNNKICCDRIAFVDFVAVGSVQEALSRLLDKEMHGYYFLRRKPDTGRKEKMQIDALYGMYGDYQMNANLYRYYYFMEMVLTSYEPSLEWVDDDGKLCFYPENRSEQNLFCIRKMHEGICRYCERMFSIVPGVGVWEASVQLYDKLLGFFSEDYLDILSGVIDGIENIDEFMGRKVSELNR